MFSKCFSSTFDDKAVIFVTSIILLLRAVSTSVEIEPTLMEALGTIPWEKINNRKALSIILVKLAASSTEELITGHNIL